MEVGALIIGLIGISVLIMATVMMYQMMKKLGEERRLNDGTDNSNNVSDPDIDFSARGDNIHGNADQKGKKTCKKANKRKHGR